MTDQPELKIPEPINGFIRSTAGWTRFLSILGFISVGFIELFAFLIIRLSALHLASDRVPLPFVGFIYIPMGALYLIPAIYLFRYSSALKKLLERADIPGIEEAVRYQKSFWKFTGVLSIIGIVIAIIGVVAAISIPFITALRR